jgi:hypothetical protein
MDRKIAISAIVMAFVGGMIFAGTPVEAKKGGGGAIIDEILLAIDALDDRISIVENEDLNQNIVDANLDERISELESSTLASLDCTENQIAKYDGTNWVCDIDEISGQLPDSLEIEGYDARDVDVLTLHDGVFTDGTGTTPHFDGSTLDGIIAGERVAIYVENQSVQKIILDEVRVGGFEYVYVQTSALPANDPSDGAYFIVVRGVAGEAAVTYDGFIPGLEAGAQVTIIVDLLDGIVLGDDAQVVITTDSGAIISGAIIAGQHSQPTI